MKSLARRLEAEIAGSQAELTTFPSGGAMLDVRRSDGRVFVMAYTPAHDYGVDEIQPSDGFVTNYRYTFSEFALAADKLQRLVAENSNHSNRPAAELNLVVIYAADLEATRRFYECLGLEFRLEKHGQGAAHYAAELGRAVFEIYPCRNGEARGAVRLGFEVASLDSVVATLRKTPASVVSEPHDSAWGRRAVVQDPDGNRVELTVRS